MEESYKDHLYSLIICGGAGTRLWPRSRQKTPKQFLTDFYGEKSLFVQTVERAKLLTAINKIFVITLSDYLDDVKKQFPEIPPGNIICEPFGKNTAMAVGIGAIYIRKSDPMGVIMNFWSDAVIKENDLFSESLNLAAKTAFSSGSLVTVGLKPLFPHTGLGYIETGEKLSDKDGVVFKVNSFKEKPNLQTAEEFIKKGNYYWNTGIYVWSVKAVIDAFLKYSPDTGNLLNQVFEAIGMAKEKEIFMNAYNSVENLSIDVAVSEKADNLLLIPANFGWSDIGDWKVAYELKNKDNEGNVTGSFGKKGWYLGIDTKNCMIESESRLIATVGVSDLVIIETKDAVLVCSRDKAQDVKKIVAYLKEKEKKEYL